MCTTAATYFNDSWHLIKTRDPVSWMRWDDEMKLFHSPVDRFKKLIVQNPDPHQDGYYGGINEKGVAFTSTFVSVAENQISYIRRPYVRLILEAAIAVEAVEIIQSFVPRIGGNMFVADSTHCFGIEGSPGEYFIEEITKPAVKTNHYLHLPDRNITFDVEPGFEAWSKQHQKRAKELIVSAHSIEDLKHLLMDRKHTEDNRAICTTRAEAECFTHSAMIFDTRAITAYYAQGNPLEVPFEVYSF
jgi:predicted choloylglycine hydrolase